LVTLFAETQAVQTFNRTIEPLRLTFIDLRFGSHRRLLCLVEWLIEWPVTGPLPQMSHLAAITGQR
jgi:hypothetical protein